MTDQAALVLHGGVVLLVGMLVGFPYGAAQVAGKDPVKEQNWRLAHNQNLQNGMLLLIVGACAGFLQLSTGLAVMAWLLIAAAYCDMAALFIRARTGYAGRLAERSSPERRRLLALLWRARGPARRRGDLHLRSLARDRIS